MDALSIPSIRESIEKRMQENVTRSPLNSSSHHIPKNTTLYVLKRDGRSEPIMFDKITARMDELCDMEPKLKIDVILVAQRVIQGIFPGVKTSQLDKLAAETSACMTTIHPDYGKLAARISISNHQKQTKKNFSEVVAMQYAHMNKKRKGVSAPLVSKSFHDLVMKHATKLDEVLKYERDFYYDYFGFETLLKNYLMSMDKVVIERPQHMHMRVALAIHGEDIDSAIKTYELLSNLIYTHATPTIFNAGTPRQQLCSCFLVLMKEDSIEGIYDTLKDCAILSKHAAGLGIAVHCIRCFGSAIEGTNGISNGLVPMLKVYESTARYVDQGGGKRKGSFAIYSEPWHADIVSFLNLRKNTGKEQDRARDLFFALWIPDLFMKRVENDENWSLFCPNEAPGLADCYGDEFDQLYTTYEATEGLPRKTMKARDLWFQILESQIETGTPYMLYKDACNKKSNQKNLGTIKCSNLCTEIIEYTAPDEIAVCCLASIALPKFVNDGGFDHVHLFEVVKDVIKAQNKVIDVNFYPVEEAKRSNMRHRPLGLGVQGEADVFVKLRLPFESLAAKTLNRDIFETIYFAALTSSNEIAQRDGPYETYEGSPISKGILQFDMWGVEPTQRWDWATLRESIKKYGVRNSLLVAPMPTASTSQILGNTEGIDPRTSNIYARGVLAGQFVVVNTQLVDDLSNIGLWNTTMKDTIIAHDGSIQNIQGIPDELKAIYKTTWEISQKAVIDMAADRGAFIDQSQSMNIYIAEPNIQKLTSMHFYGWKKGLKTGMYYLRTRPAAQAIKFTIDNTLVKEAKERETKSTTPTNLLTCEPGCDNCGS